jgi:hypothetical protein
MDVSARVTVAVEEIVLHGFAAGDRRHIGDAFKLELERLLASQPMPALLARSGAWETVRAPTVRVRARSAPWLVGRQAASAVHTALGRERPR